MTDVLGTASAALNVFESIVRLIDRLKTAATQVKELPELLEQYQGEVTQVKQWINLVKNESLQAPDLELSIQRLKKLAERLQHTLKRLSSSGGKNWVQQFWQQLRTGSADRMSIDKVMRDMAHVKLDLIVRVQLAQVGITSSIQDAVQLSVAAINAMDEKLTPLDGSYPKLALLLEDSKIVNGLIDVSKDDLDELIRSHVAQVQSNPASGSSTPRRAQKTITGNTIEKTAFAVTAPLCLEEVDPWRDSDYTFKDNKVEGWGIFHAQPDTEALKALLDANVKIAIAGSGSESKLSTGDSECSGGERSRSGGRRTRSGGERTRSGGRSKRSKREGKRTTGE